jgi:hypothetical protein
MIYSNFPNSVNIFWHLQLQGMSGSSSANIKSTDDILAYLNEIKDAFKDEVETFDDFIWVMRDYKEKRFDLFIILIENYLNFLFISDLFVSFLVMYFVELMLKLLDQEQGRSHCWAEQGHGPPQEKKIHGRKRLLYPWLSKIFPFPLS